MKTLPPFAALLVLLLGSRALAQDEEPPRPLPPTPVQEESPSANGGLEELKRLFLEVEKNLEAIDLELADAGAGETSLAEVPDAGLDDLLNQALRRSSEVQGKIDRILELAQQMGQGSGSGRGQEKPAPGESPLDEKRDRSPGDREQTPEAPRKKPADGEEKDEQQEPRGTKPGDGPEKDPTSGRNQRGDTPEHPAGDAVPHGSEADGWGFLPERVREVFRSQGRGDMPVRYRDWIDTYYRRLNASGR